MARSIRSSQLETRTSRLKLADTLEAVRRARRARRAAWLQAQRRRAAPGACIAADGKGGSWMKGFADADDHEDANGETIMDFWQAQERARVLARGEGGNDARTTPHPSRCRRHWTITRPISRPATPTPKTRRALTPHDRRPAQQAGGAAHGARAAAMARRPRQKARPRIGQPRRRQCSAPRSISPPAPTRASPAHGRGMWASEALRDAVESRNVILTDETIRQIIAAAYADTAEFGLLVETAATTGARPIQLARLEVGDVQRDRTDPRLMMPSSRKGRAAKKITRRPVPIPENLAIRLLAVGEEKADDSSIAGQAERRAVGKIGSFPAV